MPFNQSHKYCSQFTALQLIEFFFGADRFIESTSPELIYKVAIKVNKDLLMRSIKKRT